MLLKTQNVSITYEKTSDIVKILDMQKEYNGLSAITDRGQQWKTVVSMFLRHMKVSSVEISGTATENEEDLLGALDMEIEIAEYIELVTGMRVVMETMMQVNQILTGEDFLPIISNSVVMIDLEPFFTGEKEKAMYDRFKSKGEHLQDVSVLLAENNPEQYAQLADSLYVGSIDYRTYQTRMMFQATPYLKAYVALLKKLDTEKEKVEGAEKVENIRSGRYTDKEVMNIVKNNSIDGSKALTREEANQVAAQAQNVRNLVKQGAFNPYI